MIGRDGWLDDLHVIAITAAHAIRPRFEFELARLWCAGINNQFGHNRILVSEPSKR